MQFTTLLADMLTDDEVMRGFIEAEKDTPILSLDINECDTSINVKNTLDESSEIAHVPGGYLHIIDNQDGTFDVYFESTWNSSYDWKRQNQTKEEVDKLKIDKNLNEDIISRLNNLSKRLFSTSYNDLDDEKKGFIDIVCDYVNKNHGILEGNKLLQFIDDFYNEKDESLIESKETVIDAMSDLYDYLSDWYKLNLANETVDDANKAGWTEDVQKAYINFINELARDESEKVSTQETGLHISEEDSNMAVENNEAVFEQLQEALQENVDLAKTVTELQEKLSVSYAKEVKLSDEITRYQKATKTLSESVKKIKPLEAKITLLEESSKDFEARFNSSNQKAKQLRESIANSVKTNRELNEDILSKNKEIAILNDKLKELDEKYSKELKSHKNNEIKLTEDFNELKGKIELKDKQYSVKLSNANKLVEQYKSITNRVIDKYIESQARVIGVNKDEVKRRLPENYTFNDIDSICEDLKGYKLTMSKLPFSTTNLNENIQMKVTSHKKDSILPANNIADEVDEQLLSLAGL